MIIMYERKMWYSNSCSSVQDYIIKLWFYGHVLSLVLIHQVMNTWKVFWYSRKTVKTSGVLSNNIAMHAHKFFTVLFSNCVLNWLGISSVLSFKFFKRLPFIFKYFYFNKVIKKTSFLKLVGLFYEISECWGTNLRY